MAWATAAPLGDTGAYLVGSMDRDDVFAPMRAVAARVLVADVCLVVLFTLLARRVTRGILQPIHALSEAARRVSRGESATSRSTCRARSARATRSAC